GKEVAGAVSPRVAALLEGATKAMMMTRTKTVGALLLVLTLLAAAGVGAREALSASSYAATDEGITPTQPASHDPKANEETQIHADSHGDPLPAGAQARLGTTRFRHQEPVADAVFGKDGKTLITG